MKGSDDMQIKEAEQARRSRLKAEMGIHDDSKTSLAAKLGITRTALAQKMSGQREFKVSELERLAEIYNKERIYFF